MSNAEKEVNARVCVPGRCEPHTTNLNPGFPAMSWTKPSLAWVGWDCCSPQLFNPSTGLAFRSRLLSRPEGCRSRTRP